MGARALLLNIAIWTLVGAWMYRARDARMRRVPARIVTGLAGSAVVAMMAFTVHRLLIPVRPPALTAM